jgi:hypothetical protein
MSKKNGWKEIADSAIKVKLCNQGKTLSRFFLSQSLSGGMSAFFLLAQQFVGFTLSA